MKGVLTGRHPQLERLQFGPPSLPLPLPRPRPRSLLFAAPAAAAFVVGQSRTRAGPLKVLDPLLRPDQVRRVQGQVPQLPEPARGPAREDVVVEAAALEQGQVGQVRRKGRDRTERSVRQVCGPWSVPSRGQFRSVPPDHHGEFSTAVVVLRGREKKEETPATQLVQS